MKLGLVTSGVSSLHSVMVIGGGKCLGASDINSEVVPPGGSEGGSTTGGHATVGAGLSCRAGSEVAIGGGVYLVSMGTGEYLAVAVGAGMVGGATLGPVAGAGEWLVGTIIGAGDCLAVAMAAGEGLGSTGVAERISVGAGECL